VVVPEPHTPSTECCAATVVASRTVEISAWLPVEEDE